MIPFDKLSFQPNAYIGGEWVAAHGGAEFQISNPATGAVIAKVSDCGEAETSAAIAAAKRALPEWSARTAAGRAAIIHKWHDLVMENADGLARILTLEMGKPLAEARGEIAYGASFLSWFAEEGRRAYGDVIPSPWPDARIVTLRQPVGVVAAITPWNFPNAMILRKVAPALAAGCPIIVKPAEDTPLSALALAGLAQRAGVPGGVFNVIPTSKPAAVGDVLLSSEDVRKLSFTGSTATGKKLLVKAADTVKRVSMELGGNAPFIVFDDADLDKAVEGLLVSKYRNAGQTCVCANRVLVQSGIYDRFFEKLAAKTEALVVGDGLTDGTDIGPLINQAAVNKTKNLIAEALGQGASLVTGGSAHEHGPLFFNPTILRDVTPEMMVAREEIFGPVAPVIRFETEAEAVRIANDTAYGLAAYYYTADLGRAWRVGERLEFGMTALNQGILSTEVAPFGGVKQSGYGREGSHLGLQEYLDVKYMLMGGIDFSGNISGSSK